MLEVRDEREATATEAIESHEVGQATTASRHSTATTLATAGPRGRAPRRSVPRAGAEAPVAASDRGVVTVLTVRMECYGNVTSMCTVRVGA